MRLPDLLALVLSLAGLALPAVRADDLTAPSDPLRGPSLGQWIDLASAPELPRVEGDRLDRPIFAAVTVRWEEIEGELGSYDWSAVAPRVETLHGAGYTVVLCLTGSHPAYLAAGEIPSPLAGDSIAGWIRFVRDAARRFANTVQVYQIGERVGRGDPDPARYAFLLKSSALAVRASARAGGGQVRVAQATLAPGALEWQRQLWALDVSAYIDILPAAIEAHGEVESELRRIQDEVAAHPPASAIWAVVEGPTPAAGAAAAALRALDAGAGNALIDPRRTSDDPGLLPAWVLGAHAALAGRAPAPRGALHVVDGQGRPVEAARVLGRFVSEADLSTLVFYLDPGDPEPVPQHRLVVDSPFVRNARVLEPASGREWRVAVEEVPEGRALRVPRSPLPAALQYQRGGVSPGFELPPEEVRTTRERGLTAEEIIARYQQVQQQQDDRLERWTARARLDYHFNLTRGGTSIDVGIVSNYFWERGGNLEWEQTDYFINNNRAPWKKFPELPLIQGEKVVTLPLDLTLDRTYAYRLLGRDRVDGREAYMLAFQPRDPDAPLSLYRGRIWIDAESFVRLKAELIQTNLDPPVLSNEETDLYQPHAAGDAEFWMLTRLRGQQVWNTAGRTFVVQRQMVFHEFRFNPPLEEFEAQRARAYASNNLMLTDTDEGFRYMKRQADGSRVVQERVSTSQLFVGGGAFMDNSTDGVTPLLGVNYFNYDLKGFQVNALMAGVVGFFTGSKPDLIGRRNDATVDAAYSLIKSQDKVFLGGEELLEERVRDRGQHLSLRLGFPLGDFWKFNLIGDLNHRAFYDDDDASAAREAFNSANLQMLEFVLPRDHAELVARAETVFNRRGYSLALTAARAWRSDWGAWGLVDTASGLPGEVVDGVFVPGEPNPTYDSHDKWGLTAFKEWYLPRFQKLRAEVNVLGGRDLDRFSQYNFSFFGADRLNGFSGSGVRFDRGLVLRAGYNFNLLEVIRLDAAVEWATVEDPADDRGRQAFSGVGFAANLVGPWKTIYSLSYGYSLSSDIPGLEGQHEFLLMVFKLF